MATEGSIESNPLHAELLEIAAMARHDFMLDVTLTQQRQISGVFAGEPVRAHAKAVAFLEKTSLETLSEPADVVITSSAGYPLDLTFYQTVKGITAAEHIVKPGGRILLLGECAEGIGGAEFAEQLRSLTSFQNFLNAIRETPVEVDQWQLEKLALVGVAHELYFYTPGVTKDQLGCLHSRLLADIDSAVAAVLKGIPAGARVVLVPDGPYAYARAVPAYV
jgi:nickel-dependent lactate racemase